MTNVCAACGAKLVWCKSPKGKPMPLDAAPEKRIVVDNGIGRICDTWKNHLASCKDADIWRRPKEPA